MFQIGDVITCIVPVMVNLRNDEHPCLTIGITADKYQVLPITHNEELNSENKVKIDLDVLSCCVRLSGYVWIDKQDIDKQACWQRNTGSCEIGWKLQMFCKLAGIVL